MMNNYENFTSAEFTSLMADELTAYYQAQGTRFERLFYFEGQDPFAYQRPAESIATLYWGLSHNARRSMTKGLFDVLGARLELMPTQALKQIIKAIGLIQKPELLAPMVARVGQRTADVDEMRDVYVTTIMVLKGFEFQSAVIEAAQDLVGFKEFPNDLVYDIFELLLHDHQVLWSQHLLYLLGRIYKDARLVSNLERIKSRLADTAREIERLTIRKVVQGLEQLLSIDHEEFKGWDLHEREEPISMLAALLIAPHPSFPNPSFRVEREPLTNGFQLISRDGMCRSNLAKKSVLRDYVQPAPSRAVLSCEFINDGTTVS